MQKIAHRRYRGIIRLISNTRIGGNEDQLGIQSAENVVIRNPVNLAPYIPGSSIKGRMRCLLERELGLCTSEHPTGEKVKFDDEEIDNPIARIFGVHGQPSASVGPTRLMVHDAPCIKGGGVSPKTQNVVGRLSGTSKNMFGYEFVEPDSEFELGFALQMFSIDKDFRYSRDLFPLKPETQQNAPCPTKTSVSRHKPAWCAGLLNCGVMGLDAMEELLLHGIDLLNQCGIGSGTSRGYGKIEIVDLEKLPPLPRSKFSNPSGTPA